jgi:hypothetical protein
MGFQKGHAKAGGRKPGGRNKTTVAVKEALHAAFGELGGVKALVAWGKENQGEFYKLWVKTLPTEIKNADGEVFRVQNVSEVVVTSREQADAVLALNHVHTATPRPT